MPNQNNPSHEHRHVLVQRENIRKELCYGHLVLHIDSVRNATATFVPRSAPPQILRSFETPDAARAHFQTVVNVFKSSGWQILHDGLPNFG
jgi:hypothetical protein